MTQTFPRKFPVPASETGRLDQFLVQLFPGTSRNFWRAHVSTLIRVDGKKGRKGQGIQSGQWIEVLDDPSRPLRLLPNPALELRVLYSDSDLLAVDKAPGLPSHPLKEEETRTVANAVVARFPETASAGGNPLEAGLMHRLDNETSGVLLFCRNAEGLSRFRELNRAGEILKTYLAWVSGIAKPRGKITLPIAHSRNPKKMTVLPGEKGARPAETEFRRIRISNGNSLLLVLIRRGNRHQIRLHLSQLGHPVLGDKLYGNSPPETNRQLLHARRVEFQHPFLKKKIRITAPLPPDFFR